MGALETVLRGAEAGQKQADRNVFNSLKQEVSSQIDDGTFTTGSKAFNKLMLESPAMGNIAKTFATIPHQRKKDYFEMLQSIRPMVANGDRDSAKSFLDQRINNMMQYNQSGQNIPVDPSMSIMVRDKLDRETDEQLLEGIDFSIQAGIQGGYLDKGVAQSAESRAFNDMTAGLSEQDKARARRIKLGLDPRAVGSAGITTAETEGLTEKVASSEGTIAGAKEGAKLKQQSIWKPQIEAAVIAARKLADKRGDVFNELNRMETGLPILNENISKLTALASVATHTMAGKAWDTLVREFGFGSTKGGRAAETFEAIINNMILPELKPTFGSQLSDAEYERLKSTIGSAGAPGEKIAVLTAFIEQKTNDIRMKQAELGGLDGGRPAMGGYTIGQKEDGYEYIGGDPASEESWKKL